MMKKKLLFVTVAFLSLAVNGFAQSIPNPYVKDGITYSWGTRTWTQTPGGSSWTKKSLNVINVVEIDWDAPEILDFSSTPLPDELPGYFLNNFVEKACRHNQVVKELKRSYVPNPGGGHTWEPYNVYVSIQAFYNCQNLEKVDLSMRGHYNQWNVDSAAFQIIRSEAFAKCKSLSEVHLTASEIEEKAFANCTALQRMYVHHPNLGMAKRFTVKVDPSSFEGVDVSKVQLYVPEQEVDDYRSHPIWGAFNVLPMDMGYYGETSATDEEGVTIIKYGPGKSYRLIHTIEEDCSENIHLAKYADITKISKSACKNNKNVKSVSFQSTSAKPLVVDDEAFYGCPRLESVNLFKETSYNYDKARGVDIRPYAFAECASLKTLTLPHPTHIAAHAFDNCTNLEKIYVFFRSLDDVDIDEHAFDGISREHCKIYVARHFCDELRHHPLFGQFEILPFEDSEVGHLVSSAYYGIDYMWREHYSENRIYSDIIKIYNSGQGDVSLYTDVDIKDRDVYMIRSYAAENNSSLKRLNFTTLTNNQFVNSLGEEMPFEIQTGAFRNCPNFEECNFIPDFRPSYARELIIGDEVFANCEQLQKVTISRVKSIGDRAFSNCTNLQEIIFLKPDFNMLGMGENVFEGVNCANCKLYVPSYTVPIAKAHPIWGKFDVRQIPVIISSADGEQSGKVEVFYDTDNEFLYLLRKTEDLTIYDILDNWPGCEDVHLSNYFNDYKLNYIYPLYHDGNQTLRSFTFPYQWANDNCGEFTNCPNLERVDLRLEEGTLLEDTRTVYLFPYSGSISFSNASTMNLAFITWNNSNHVNFVNCPSLKTVLLWNLTQIPPNFMQGCISMEKLYIDFITDDFNNWQYDERAFDGVSRSKCVIYVPQEYVEGVKAHPLLGQFTVLPISEFVDGITESIKNNSVDVTGYYTIDGKKIFSVQRGINIIRLSDGTVKKVIVK